MRKVFVVIFAATLVFAVTGIVRAQEDIEATPSAETAELPSPGITPDSPFYFFDTLSERIGLFFARSAEAKARKSLEIAEEKLAEAEVMADQDKEDAVETAVNRYGETMSVAAGALAQAAKTGEGFDEALKSLIAQATSKHLSVLSEVYEKVPEKAQGAIQQAMEKSGRGGEEALKAIEAVETRERVHEEVRERWQEVERRLEGLREEGKPIPSLPSFGPPESEEGEEGERGLPGRPAEEGGPAQPMLPSIPAEETEERGGPALQEQPSVPDVPGAGGGGEEGGSPGEIPGPPGGRGR